MSDKPSIIVLGFDVTYDKGKAIEWVNYSPAHSPLQSQNRERIDFVNPEKMKIRQEDENGAMKGNFMRSRWALIEPAYKAWKAGHEIPVDGTPLAAWPGLNQAQAQEFRKLGIKSVEHIAEMNDALMMRIQLPGVRDIIAQAKAFLESADRNETATRITSIEAVNKELQEKLDAAMQLIAEIRPPEGKRQARRAPAEEANA